MAECDGWTLDTATLIVLISPHWHNMTDLLLGAGRGYWLPETGYYLVIITHLQH